MTAALDFIAGFLGAIFQHVARVVLWAFMVMVVAIILGFQPSWRLLALIVAANVLGGLIYPDNEPTEE